MKAVLQRVTRAAVRVDGRIVGAIDSGLLVLLGVHRADTPADAEWIAGRIPRLRIFDDATGAMNRALSETGGGVLVVSQFTLLADVRRGARPSFNEAAPTAAAIPLYELVVARLAAALGRPVATGEFGARMEVELANDGPVTILLDSRDRGNSVGGQASADTVTAA